MTACRAFWNKKVSERPAFFCGFCNFSEPLIIYIMKEENSAVEDKEGDNCERRFV